MDGPIAGDWRGRVRQVTAWVRVAVDNDAGVLRVDGDAGADDIRQTTQATLDVDHAWVRQREDGRVEGDDIRQAGVCIVDGFPQRAVSAHDVVVWRTRATAVVRI